LPVHELFLPYPQFCRLFSHQTPHICSYCLAIHVRDSNHTHSLTSLQVMTLSQQPLTQTGVKASLQNGCHGGREDCFLNPLVHRRTAMVHSEPTMAFLKRRPETAMLPAPFGCTHPPPPIPLKRKRISQGH